MIGTHAIAVLILYAGDGYSVLVTPPQRYWRILHRRRILHAPSVFSENGTVLPGTLPWTLTIRSGISFSTGIAIAAPLRIYEEDV